MIRPVSEHKDLETAVVRFAGDSGDGMQVVGELFSDSTAHSGNSLATFPDYPSEIRAPQGSVPGVSGYQIQFGSAVLTPGDSPDALVAMNPAALRVNLPDLQSKALVVVNVDAFNERNLEKAGYKSNPLDDPDLALKYQLVKLNITGMATAALAESPLKPSDKARTKNFFALGFMVWAFDRNFDYVLKWIERKWKNQPEVAEANAKVFKAGYYYGETCEQVQNRYIVKKAPVIPGLYRKVTGNEAVALGFAAASQCFDKQLVLGSYPITPATTILETLANLKNAGIKTVQAEDEIAAIGVAIGASYAGSLGITTTSGPGLCLKSEFINLAVMSELPLVIVDVQRAGPSTGLPTKSEQSDLLQAMYGRNGESPLVVMAAKFPSDCFDAAFEAARLALTYNTPVILLTDGYLANGSEPWKIPDESSLLHQSFPFYSGDADYQPYSRNPDTLVRTLAVPGQAGLEHRIGGLEKNDAGLVTHDVANHDRMCRLRKEKVDRIADTLPPVEIFGEKKGKLLVLGWGSTYGSIHAAVRSLQKEGHSISSLHLRYLNPFPKGLEEALRSFEKVLVPELNLGQLSMLLRERFLLPIESFAKVQGKFTVNEMKAAVLEALS